MQLNAGERSILAYFPTSDSAEQAATVLEKAGFKRPRIDRISRYGLNPNPGIDSPINNAVTETGPTLFSDSTGENISDSERILLAADPSVSGYGSPGYGVAGGKAFLLTLVAHDDKIQQAEEIVGKYGGKV